MKNKKPLSFKIMMLLPTAAMSTGLPTGNWDHLGTVLITFSIILFVIYIAINYVLYQKFKSRLKSKAFDKAKVFGIVLVLFNTVVFFLSIGVFGLPWAIVCAYLIYRKYNQALQQEDNH